MGGQDKLADSNVQHFGFFSFDKNSKNPKSPLNHLKRGEFLDKIDPSLLDKEKILNLYQRFDLIR